MLDFINVVSIKQLNEEREIQEQREADRAGMLEDVAESKIATFKAVQLNEKLMNELADVKLQLMLATQKNPKNNKSDKSKGE